jgi:putative spermidine/putrescine transport system permease protein
MHMQLENQLTTPPIAGRVQRLGTAVRAYTSVSPALIAVGFAFLYPTALLIWLSFTDPQPGIDNYTSIFSDSLATTVIGRTLRMAGTVTVVTALLAYAYAYVMTAVGNRMRAVMLVLVLMPFWTSLMARTFAWVVLLQERGPIDDLFSLTPIGSVELLGTTTGVTIAMTQVMMPFFVLPLFASLRGIDRRLIDAALGMGARPVVAFFKVYLPLSLNGLLAGAAMVFTLSLGFYVTPELLGTPRESMIARLMASKVDPLLQFGAAGALAVVVLFITLALLGVILAVLKLRGGVETTGGSK